MKIRVISVILFVVIMMSVLFGCGTGSTTEIENRLAALEKENENLRNENNNAIKKDDITDPIIEDKTEIDNSNKCVICDNVKTSNSEYCLEHKCFEPDCSNIKEPSSNYCSTHECMDNKCHNKRTSMRGSMVCSEHECMDSSCVYKKGDGNYCIHHTCQKELCKNQKLKAGVNYCSEHVCQKSGCSFLKKSGSNFCGSHS